MKINYDKPFKRKMKQNLADVKKSLNEEWLQKKVKNFSQKFEIFSEKEIFQRIKSDKVAAAFFAKDPSKQGIHEKTAYDFLKGEFGEGQLLPKSGKNARYVVNGDISSKRSGKKHKSIDFIFNYKGFVLVCSHKYTKENGGGQDNQRNDLINFVESAKKPAEGLIFIAIADGNYYQESSCKNLNEIKKAAKSVRILVTTSENILNDVNDLIKKLKKK